ncbi:hypothetical protein [Herbaspirillum sp.]|uniref:hypothetical protein n=1 Tax=Herbaspirillum sp. TaxID=1890675 RepID=UPI0031D1F5D1
MTEDQIEEKKKIEKNDLDKKYMKPCRACGEMLNSRWHRRKDPNGLGPYGSATYVPCPKCGEPEPIRLLHDSTGGAFLALMIVIMQSTLIAVIGSVVIFNVALRPFFCSGTTCERGGDILGEFVIGLFLLYFSFRMLQGRLSEK